MQCVKIWENWNVTTELITSDFNETYNRLPDGWLEVVAQHYSIIWGKIQERQ